MIASNRLFNLKNSLLAKLFEREEAHLTQRANQLIRKNVALGGSPDGFRHLGVIYSDLTGSMRKQGNFTPLHMSLVPEIMLILEERTTMERERQQIGQAFTLVLRDCQTAQDLRDALPNGMQHLIPECQGLERMRPEGFTLEGNQRAMGQYMKLKEKAEYYIAAQLLY